MWAVVVGKWVWGVVSPWVVRKRGPTNVRKRDVGEGGVDGKRRVVQEGVGRHCVDRYR